MDFASLKREVIERLANMEREAKALVQYCHRSGGAISSSTAIEHAQTVSVHGEAIAAALAEHEKALEAQSQDRVAQEPPRQPGRVRGAAPE